MIDGDHVSGRGSKKTSFIIYSGDINNLGTISEQKGDSNSTSRVSVGCGVKSLIQISYAKQNETMLANAVGNIEMPRKDRLNLTGVCESELKLWPEG